MGIECSVIVTMFVAVFCFSMVVMVFGMLMAMVVMMLVLGVIVAMVIVMLVLGVIMAMVVVMLVLGVIMAMVVVVVVVIVVIVVVFEGDRLDPVGGHHACATEVRGVDQPVDPAFELQPVDDEDISLTHRARVGGGRLIDMGIAIGAYERRDNDMLAPDALHHVAKDREGRNDRDWLARLGRDRSGERQGKDSSCGLEESSAGRHGASFQASRWRRGKACATRPPDGPSTSDIP